MLICLYLLQRVLLVVPDAVTNPPTPPAMHDGFFVPAVIIAFGIWRQSPPVVLVPLVPYPQHNEPYFLKEFLKL